MSNDSFNLMQHAALNYLKEGYAVLPIFSPSMLGDVNKITLIAQRQMWLDRLIYPYLMKCCKLPIHCRFLLHAITTAKNVETWFSRYPNANIAVQLGREANVVVLDVDYYDGVENELIALQLPPTKHVRSGLGEHFYFRYPDRMEIARRHTVHKTFLLGDSCWIVAPPSMHACGRQYQWLDHVIPIAPLPPSLLNLKHAIIHKPIFILLHNIFHISWYKYVLYPMLKIYVRLR
jgi:hypothetical protein